MPPSNRDRVGQALDLLGEALKPYVEREMQAAYGDRWLQEAAVSLDREIDVRDAEAHLDVYALLKIMWEQWNQVFKRVLSFGDRTLAAELRDVRNRWAHQESFTTDDAYRALDSAQRLLMAISAGDEAAQVDRQKQELLRQRFEEQARKAKKQAAKDAVEVRPTAGLKPWREIATPHDDVASGRYQQAEFAADLGQVFRGEATSEYQDPREFFRRTFITGGLHDLLVQAIQRIAGAGGNPVVGLQTNFGGGKTHSLLALLHLFSGASPSELPGVDGVMKDAGVPELPKVSRAVLVGTHISPAKVYEKPDGTKVRTLWGELAWQLGGKEGHELVAEADVQGVNPGDSLHELFRRFSPCLVLIDEWVAYARQLYTKHDLPAGDFDAHFSFAQALTEAAKEVPGTLVVVSIPASDREIGGEGGKEALKRLENVVRRADSPWRPASAEEGFEIVRRRLFKHIGSSPERDAVVKAFLDLYRGQSQEFPQEEWSAYEDRLKAAYPIHPELFDRLYQDWSTLEDFQLTRGVLRLMAAVIHVLWEQQDGSLLIMPCNVPVDHPDVHFHLMQYIEDTWAGVISADVDGPNSVAMRIDRDNPNLGRLSATRRVSRTIFMGAAPTVGTANPGIDDRRIKLGSVQPGEPPAVFGDALRRLSDEAMYLYLDKGRYWFDTKPTITKTASQRANQLSRENDVLPQIVQRLRAGRERGDFAAVHVAPASGADVPDEDTARLVILDPEHHHSSGNDESPARLIAAKILQERGTGPRRNRNMLVFLAADRARLEDLEKAVRQYLAWRSINDERDALNLDSFQRKQAETKLEQSDEVVEQRIPESYAWLLVPTQPQASGPVEWASFRIQGQDPLAVRASGKLKTEEFLITEIAPTRLRLELDRVPLWQGDHVGLKQLWEYFAQYLYLPRLRDSGVLINAVQDGVASTTWNPETFAYAEGFDEATGEYRGLRAGEVTSVVLDAASVIVKPEVAAAHIASRQPAGAGSPSAGAGGVASAGAGTGTSTPPPVEVVRRFHGVADLDPLRVNKEVGDIVEHVLQHLAGLPNADIEVTLEIQADVAEGVPDNVVRTVTENARTLKFRDHGFEKE